MGAGVILCRGLWFLALGVYLALAGALYVVLLALESIGEFLAAVALCSSGPLDRAKGALWAGRRWLRDRVLG